MPVSLLPSRPLTSTTLVWFSETHSSSVPRCTNAVLTVTSTH